MKNLKKAIILAAVLSAQTLVSTRAHAFIFPVCLFHSIGSVSSEDVSSCAKDGVKYGTVFGAALGLLTLNPGFFVVGAGLAFMDSDENLQKNVDALTQKYPGMSQEEARSLVTMVLNAINQAKNDNQPSIEISESDYISAAPKFFEDSANRANFFNGIKQEISK